MTFDDYLHFFRCVLGAVWADSRTTPQGILECAPLKRIEVRAITTSSKGCLAIFFIYLGKNTILGQIS